ncbi:MAG: NAD(P)H-quinone oxidoreductase [Acidobacteria bacterium]|nr:NAD(P)H-quinone oxidoreductase [Acidobacteriota bacterium]MBI3657099.1 NAD(P)H-quinone oxidoreductase [Acidobacteriota bacterium]
MKAVRVRDDESHSLYLEDVARPRPHSRQALIRVCATAVNRADLLQRHGLYPPPPGESDILGLEIAGEIAEIGPSVAGWAIGNRVCCLLVGGAYAEYAVTDADMLLPIPESLTFAEAAAIPEAFYTAFLNLFLEGGLQKGHVVLIHAGASGVGTAALQLARAAGATVWVTVGSEEKRQRCMALGAHFAINYTSEDFCEQIRQGTGGAGVNIILDCVGASYFAKNLECLTVGGCLVIIGGMGGTHTDLDLIRLMRNRLRVIGSVLRSRSLTEKIAITKELRRRIWPLFEQKIIRPVVDSQFSLADVAAAHARMANNQNVGKIILTIP